MPRVDYFDQQFQVFIMIFREYLLKYLSHQKIDFGSKLLGLMRRY